MANYNYGINCETNKHAEKLFQHIEQLNIYQDGLDFSEERVSVISSQALKEEVEKFASANSGEIFVEIWPGELEYDEAEEKGALETYEFSGKKS